MIFCELGSSGFSRYSFMTIFECSSQSFQASFETLSKTRLPISPRHGIRSRPGNSLSNFTQCTMRVPGFTSSLDAGVGPQVSLAMPSPHARSFYSPYCNFVEIPSCVPLFHVGPRNSHRLWDRAVHRTQGTY